MRICFFGDSLVNGVGDPEGLGWVGRVCVAARRRGHDLTFYNLGIRRDTSADIGARWEMQAARRLPPDLAGRLVFAFGANDCVDEGNGPRLPVDRSLAEARGMLAAAQRRHPTLMVGPPPLAIPGAAERLAALSRHLAALCGELGLPYLDLHTPLAAAPLWPREIAEDGAHPGAAGYALIAELVEAWPAWCQWLA